MMSSGAILLKCLALSKLQSIRTLCTSFGDLCSTRLNSLYKIADFICCWKQITRNVANLHPHFCKLNLSLLFTFLLIFVVVYIGEQLLQEFYIFMYQSVIFFIYSNL